MITILFKYNLLYKKLFLHMQIIYYASLNKPKSNIISLDYYIISMIYSMRVV